MSVVQGSPSLQMTGVSAAISVAVMAPSYRRASSMRPERLRLPGLAALWRNPNSASVSEPPGYEMSVPFV